MIWLPFWSGLTSITKVLMGRIFLLGTSMLAVTFGAAQPPNNICENAIELTIDLDDGCFGTGEFAINDATPSSIVNPSCDLDTQDPRKDIWFRFAAGTSDLRVALNVPLAFNPLKSFTMTIYRGSCDQLVEVACLISKEDQFNVLQVDSLTKGEELLLRLGTPVDSIGAFQLCLIFYPDSTQKVDCDNIVVYVPNDTVIGHGDEIRFRGGHDPFDLPVLYQWFVGDSLICTHCRDLTLRPKSSSIYTFLVSYANCQVKEDVAVTLPLTDDEKAIYIPDIFTPNSDNHNDRFRLFGGSQLRTILQLDIYDRWGMLLYQSGRTLPSQVDYGWDGTFKGKLLDNGTFVYLAKVEFEDGSTRDLKGSFLLMK